MRRSVAHHGRDSNPYRWVIFWVIAVQYLFVYFHRVCPAVVAPELVRSFGISGTALGVLASAYFYPYAAMQIPAGMLADSWGVRKTATLFGGISALGAVLFALAPAFGFAVFARVLVGLGVAAVFVSAMKLFANWFRGIEYGRVSGSFLALGGVGWLSATTPLALIAQYFDWRLAFLLTGCVGAIVTVIGWVLLRDRPGGPGARASAIHSAEPLAAMGLGRGLLHVLSTPAFWAIALWFVADGAMLTGFLGLWAGPCLMDVYGLSKPATGNVLAMIAVGMIVGAPLLGYLSDRVLASRKKVLVGCTVLQVANWGLMVACHGNLGFSALMGLYFLMGISVSAVGIIAITTTKELFPVEMAGISVGAVNMFPFLGTIIFQPLAGFLLDRAGTGAPYASSAYLPVLWTLFGVSVLALISISLCRETLRREA